MFGSNKIQSRRDTELERVRFVKVEYYNTIRNEFFSDVYETTGSIMSVGDSYYFFIDSGVFSRSQFKKQGITLMDSERKEIPLDRYRYEIDEKPEIDAGSITIYF